MARIAGIDIPKKKRGEIALTYIYGIGRSTAQKILTEADIDWSKKVQDWTDDEQNSIRTIIGDTFKVEGELRSEIQMNIKRLHGYWFLPRNPSSYWTSSTRTANQEQCPNPKRSKENCC